MTKAELIKRLMEIAAPDGAKVRFQCLPDRIDEAVHWVRVNRYNELILSNIRDDE